MTLLLYPVELPLLAGLTVGTNRLGVGNDWRSCGRIGANTQSQARVVVNDQNDIGLRLQLIKKGTK